MPKHKCLKDFAEAIDLGANAFRSTRGAGRPVISTLSVEDKKNLAYSLGVPAEGSGLPGAWQFGDEDRVVAIPFTDESVDRHGTAFLSKGWEFDEYLRNPVFLDGHNQEKPPLGMTLAISPASIKGKGGTSRSGFVAHVLFSRDDLNPNAEVVYRNWMAGRLRGSSVGFRPIEIRPPDEDEVKSMDLRGDDADAWIISRAELLEISAVTVPSNPSAVQRSALAQEIKDMAKLSHKSGVFSRSDLELLYGVRALADAIEAEGLTLPEKRETMSSEELLSFAKLADPQEEIVIDDTARQVPEVAQEETRSPACRMADETKSECVSRKVPEIMAEDPDMDQDQAVAVANSMCSKPCDDEYGAEEVTEARNVVPYKAYSMIDEKWDGAAARAETKAWASSGDEINMAKYRAAFTYYEGDEEETLGAYKLPHHNIREGKMVTNLRGVQAAMSALLGGRGGVDMPDDERRGVYNHLAKHYREFDKEPPEFRVVDANVIKKDLEALQRMLEGADEDSVPEEIVLHGTRYLKADPEMESKLQVLADVRDLAAQLTANEELRGEGLFGALQLLKEEVTALRAEVAELGVASGKEPNDEPEAPERESDLYNRLLDLQSKLISVTE